VLNARWAVDLYSGAAYDRRHEHNQTERKHGTQTENKHRTEPPWNVIFHNEWENPLRRVILVMRKVIPEMTLKRATKTAWEAHCKGRAVVKRCHKELAELHGNLLQAEELIVSLEPVR
jgi:ATP-dependent Clp protease adaptor protein ClpS